MPQTEYDYIIIGAGLCGLATAHFLNKRGIDSFAIITGKSQVEGRKVKLSGGLLDDLSEVVSYGFGGNKDLWGGRVTYDASASEMSCINQECIDFVNSEIFQCDIGELSANYDEIWLNRASLSHLNYLRTMSIEGYVDRIETGALLNRIYLDDGDHLLAKHVIICAGAFETARLVANLRKDIKQSYFGHISATYDLVLTPDRKIFQFLYCDNALVKNYAHKNPDTNAVYSIVNQDFSSNDTFLTSFIALLIKLRIMAIFMRNPILERSISERFNWRRTLKGLFSFRLDDFVDTCHLVYQKIVLKRRLPVRLLRNPENAFRLHFQIPGSDYTSSVVGLDGDGTLHVNWEWKENRLTNLAELIASDLSQMGLETPYISELEESLDKSKDGYHSFNLLPVDYTGENKNLAIAPDLTVKGFRNIAVGSTALISSQSLHFPTFMGVLLSVQATMNQVESN